MKNILTYTVTLVFTILLALLLWHSLHRANEHGVPPKMERTDKRPEKSANKKNFNSKNNTQEMFPVHNDIKPTVTNSARLLDIVNRLADGKNVPIEFFGQFLDQDSNIITAVNIKVSVRHWTVPDPLVPEIGSKEILFERNSDNSGRFELHGETGDVIHIESVYKIGYRLSPKISHNFGSKSGSFENPVVIRMWKDGTKEPLIGGSHVYGIDSDGGAYTIDLLSGKKIKGAAEGDLRVFIKRPNGVGQRDKYRWSFSIEAIQGGLLESDDEFMYLAPQSNYEHKIEMNFNPDDSTWAPFVKKQFFLRSRNGQIYGRAQVEIDSIYNVHSAFQIDYAINPNGSRNLQP
jgi:hypothetical protein